MTDENKKGKEELVNVHIKVSSFQREWLKDVVNSGEYTSVSEVIREAIRLLKDKRG